MLGIYFQRKRFSKNKKSRVRNTKKSGKERKERGKYPNNKIVFFLVFQMGKTKKGSTRQMPTNIRSDQYYLL